MIYKKLSLLILFFATGLLTASAQKSPQDMDRFIDALMKKMTTEEKIGQLNLPVTGEITTGQAKSSDIAGKIKKGEVGGLFNLKGVEKIREVQKQAVEESRLGIPLLFGMDVIHGYETMFPIQGELREAIRHERRVELGLEFDRFYDLVRWGIAKEVLQAAGKNYQDKNALLPLPQTEIDKSKGVLVQNPDYQ